MGIEKKKIEYTYKNIYFLTLLDITCPESCVHLSMIFYSVHASLHLPVCLPIHPSIYFLFVQSCAEQTEKAFPSIH